VTDKPNEQAVVLVHDALMQYRVNTCDQFCLREMDKKTDIQML
jgi:hypothetical protein